MSKLACRYAAGSRADPSLAERVAQLEEGEEATLYSAAEYEIQAKGYQLMVKRETAHLGGAVRCIYSTHGA
jgi:hypothetical protein